MNSTNMVQQKHNYQSRGRPGRAGDPRVGLLRELADPLRLRVVDRLGHRGPATVSQLAGELAVPLPQLSNHLRRLREAGLVRVERRGRQAVYQLGDPGLETLLPLLDRITGHLRPLARPSLAASRTCYDHLAGPLGVGLYRAMVGHRALEERPDGTVELGEAASPTLAALGVDVAASPQGAVAWPSSASTPPSAPPTWPAPSATPSPPPCSPAAGSSELPAAAPSSSPRPGPAACGGRSA